ncbi:MAG: gamma-glutamyl-gamma-aminobutyrate hydrolase family protein [Phycisphaerales bacterium]|nr:MAG: gamma-glutamyl-gamma-aminobutyrate hydrolase family protein [Phycisphaerales bacterium]
MTTHDETTPAEEVKASKPKRWLRRTGIAVTALLVVVVGAYLVAHFVYPHWLQRRVPEDAPRIAFSLDNSLLGQVGITDVTYQRAMAKAGGRLITFRPDAAGDPNVSAEAVKALLERERIDGVLLTGGGDVDPNLYGGSSDNTMLVHRLRDDFEIALIQTARNANLPILGICRGCQIINVALGGTIRNLRDEKDMKGCHLALTGHPVQLVPDSTLAEVLGVTTLAKVVSLHGQAVGELAPQARIAATGPSNVVEAIEVDTPAGAGWIIGLQWHPEMTLDDELQLKVFQNLVDRARIARDRRRSH